MSVVCVFLFLSTFCFRCWGYKNSRGARWAGNFCSPLCELATISLLDPYFSRNRYIKVRSGILFGFFFLFRPSGCAFLVFLFLGLVAASFWAWVLGFLLRAISRCFSFCVSVSAFRLLAFLVFCLRSCILHLSLLG